MFFFFSSTINFSLLCIHPNRTQKVQPWRNGHYPFDGRSWQFRVPMSMVNNRPWVSPLLASNRLELSSSVWFVTKVVAAEVIMSLTSLSFFVQGQIMSTPGSRIERLVTVQCCSSLVSLLAARGFAVYIL